MNEIEKLAKQYDELLNRLPLDQAHHGRADTCIILSGMSGSGKTTIGKILEGRYGYSKLRNTYTRPQRIDETTADGIFIDIDTFHKWEQQGRFVTTKITNGHWHGLTIDELDRARTLGEKIWADKSVGSVQKLGPHFYTTADLVYIAAPSFHILYDRILARNHVDQSLSPNDLLLRFTEEVEEFKQSFALPYRYIINDTVEDTIRKILS